MKPPLIDAVAATLAELGDELTAAQHGPIDPAMRAEFARLAAAAKATLGRAHQSHAAAAESIAAKRERVQAMAAANQAAIKAKQNPPPAEPPEPQSPTPPIDPALGRRLAAELLARQAARQPIARPIAGSVLDDWDWTTRAPSPSGTVEALARQTPAQ